MAYIELPLFTTHGVRAFIGGCYIRGEGSKFRAKAHTHFKEQIICFRSDKWIHRTDLLIHELAHAITKQGHTDKWRAKVLELGGTIEANDILRSYEKRKRS